MISQPTSTDLRSILGRIVHPPLGEARFWVLQLSVLVIAGVHLLSDISLARADSAFPFSLPVALMIIPILYAALHYGLSGSAATAIWAVLLWLPDLLLPHDQGHPGSDLVNLALVVLVAIVVGHRIEAERLAHTHITQLNSERLAAETLYRQLFEANRSPILVLDGSGVVRDANTAATFAFGQSPVGQRAESLCEATRSLAECAGQIASLPDDRDYRIEMATLAHDNSEVTTQLIFEDVTEEVTGERRATHYARLVVQAEEDQRLRLSRELHDEPLQLFLHIARRLEGLAEMDGLPLDAATRLAEVHDLTLEAAGSLRSVTRDLRPPALDQLGLVAAISSLLSDVKENEPDLFVKLEVSGNEVRLVAPFELGVFRITQEAIHNTVRHAGATRLIVRIDFRSQSLALRISDDGCGFEPDTQDLIRSGHLGLLGMHERARLLEGGLEVASAPNSGTIVSALFPISSGSAVQAP
ncbi:MAG: sensor histidine kinase [Ferrimicrobium sp.]|uniref:sensor histidine kinase n=1 Tax=Ferrimicrobium sp. TaxID=2926050 RepID=UPI002620E50A|nr:sensor histidine kinase [Ferrimicrobium sp.]